MTQSELARRTRLAWKGYWEAHNGVAAQFFLQLYYKYSSGLMA